jgi:hypothetical protein
LQFRAHHFWTIPEEAKQIDDMLGQSKLLITMEHVQCVENRFLFNNGGSPLPDYINYKPMDGLIYCK